MQKHPFKGDKAMRQGLDKQVIIQMAAQIADTEGYDQITLARLAKQLDIKSPSLYNHIQGLSDLRKELALFAIQKLKDRLIHAVAGRSHNEAIIALGSEYVNFVREHAGLYEATLAAPEQNDSDIERDSEEIVNLILRIIEPYELQKKEAIHVVRGLRSIVHGFASLELKKGFNMQIDRQESLKRVLEIFMDGVKRNFEK